MRHCFIVRASSSLAASSKLGTRHLKMKENRERGRGEGNGSLGLGSEVFFDDFFTGKGKKEGVLLVM